MKIACGVALLVLLGGCSTIYTRPVDEVLRDAGREAGVPPGIRVEGYVTADGVEHLEQGHVIVLPSGDLRLRPVEAPYCPVEDAVTLPREDVSALLIEDMSTVGKVIFWTVAIPVGLVLYLALNDLADDDDEENDD